jgi:hypothetical protein
MTHPETVYYLPGANGQLSTGLGEGLKQRGLTVFGRATVGEFRQFSFDDQVQIIAEDLRSAKWWSSKGKVVVNSYGSYLFLHAQMHMPPYPGSVLMLSPILGSFENAQTGQSFFPPYADHLMRAARNKVFPVPTHLQIHVGSLDWQSPPNLVSEFSELVCAKLSIAAGRGHMLGSDYVGPVLDRWLDEVRGRSERSRR